MELKKARVEEGEKRARYKMWRPIRRRSNPEVDWVECIDVALLPVACTRTTTQTATLICGGPYL